MSRRIETLSESYESVVTKVENETPFDNFNDAIDDSFNEGSSNLNDYIYYMTGLDSNRGFFLKEKIKTKLMSFFSKSDILPTQINSISIYDKNFVISYFGDNGEKTDVCLKFELGDYDNDGTQEAELVVQNNVSLVKLKETRREKESILRNISRDMDNIVDAMNHIISVNNRASYVFGRGNLDKNDILKTDRYGKDLEGKTLQELSVFMDEMIVEYDSIRTEIMPFNPSGEESFYEDSNSFRSKRRYLFIILGAGETNELGAGYFDGKPAAHIRQLILGECESKKDIPSLLKYIKYIYGVLSSNEERLVTFESRTKESSSAYAFLIDTILDYTLDRMKRSNLENIHFLNFAKLVTGRGDLKDDGEGWENELYQIRRTRLPLDPQFRRPDKAIEALTYVFIRESETKTEPYEEKGILERLNDNLKLEDDLVGNKSVSSIVGGFISLFDSDKVTKLEGEEGGKEFVIGIGFGSLLSYLGSGEKKYSDLTIDQKIMLSALFRLKEKIKDEKGSVDVSKIQSYIQDLVIKSSKELSEAFSDNFRDGLFSVKDIKKLCFNDCGMYGTEIEIYDLFNDMVGTGWDLSDSGVQTRAAIAKIIITVGVSIACFSLAGPKVLGSGVVVSANLVRSYYIKSIAAGLGGSLADIYMNPKDYRNTGEGLLDVSSNLSVGALSGLTGGYIGARFSALANIVDPKDLKTFSKYGVGALSGDFVAGFFMEDQRSEAMSSKINPTQLFSDPDLAPKEMQWLPGTQRIYNMGADAIKSDEYSYDVKSKKAWDEYYMSRNK